MILKIDNINTEIFLVYKKYFNIMTKGLKPSQKRKKIRARQEKRGLVCGVCFSYTQTKTKCCSQRYCFKCFLKWNENCPLCRNNKLEIN